MEVREVKQNSPRSTAQTRRRAALMRRRKAVLTALSFVCLYLAISVVSVQIKLRGQQMELQRIQQQIELARQENDELVRILNGGEAEYIERIAREKLGYAAVDERVFEDIAGIG